MNEEHIGSLVLMSALSAATHAAEARGRQLPRYPTPDGRKTKKSKARDKRNKTAASSRKKNRR